MPASLALYHASLQKERHTYAKTLAQQLDLPFSSNAVDYDYILAVTDYHLELRKPHTKLKPLFVDFHDPAYQRRCSRSNPKNELIARAVGIKKESLTILDATAGLGQDAFLLASLGCKVHCLERSKMIAALLQDGINRAQCHITLTVIDANEYLSTALPVDVVYLDPMFPSRQKTALAGKEMRMLHDLVGNDEDASSLLSKALKCAKRRVVVKRPRLAPCINERKPDIVYKGKSCRFDVYCRLG